MHCLFILFEIIIGIDPSLQELSFAVTDFILYCLVFCLSGGQWNSGGQCDGETQPIKNDTYLPEYPPKMAVLESVLKGMKTHVTYLNITRMTEYRKDGHPSIYRKQNLTDAEMRSPLSFQDCSHWCLPGVPDSWNEILYGELLVKLNRRGQWQQQPQERPL